MEFFFVRPSQDTHGVNEEERTEYDTLSGGFWNYWSSRFPNLIIHAWHAYQPTWNGEDNE